MAKKRRYSGRRFGVPRTTEGKVAAAIVLVLLVGGGVMLVRASAGEKKKRRKEQRRKIGEALDRASKMRGEAGVRLLMAHAGVSEAEARALLEAYNAIPAWAKVGVDPAGAALELARRNIGVFS